MAKPANYAIRIILELLTDKSRQHLILQKEIINENYERLFCRDYFNNLQLLQQLIIKVLQVKIRQITMTEVCSEN